MYRLLLDMDSVVDLIQHWQANKAVSGERGRAGGSVLCEAKRLPPADEGAPLEVRPEEKK